MKVFQRLAAAFALLSLVPAAHADAPRDRFSAAGYFRIMTRPDFQGGYGNLGYWNLHGRLLNEGPYGMLEMKLDVVPPTPGTQNVWASIHTKLEGGSFQHADPGNGRLDNFRASQLFVRAGNILLEDVTWQIGTLHTYWGDLGIYDLKPSQLFFETIGLSALYKKERFEVLLGVGDSGFALRPGAYNTVLTAGGSVLVRPARGVEVGVGGQIGFEPAVPGHRNALYASPDVSYEDFVRGEVYQRYFERFPSPDLLVPRPEPRSALSGLAVGYVSFNAGPLQNVFHGGIARKHPTPTAFENYQGQQLAIFTADLTDERTEVTAGNQMLIALIPERLDALWGALYSGNFNADNTIKPGEDNRVAYATLLRLQYYLSQTVHLLAESSIAQEKSLLGNLYREHSDSIFQSTQGRADARGLELGDSAVRNTWQLKTGVVLNPSGRGIFTRPSLRLLYGLQYSNQHAAFGSGFTNSLDQYDMFNAGPTRHWHHVVAIEAEGWF